MQLISPGFSPGYQIINDNRALARNTQKVEE
jgi:hypothetical protein